MNRNNLARDPDAEYWRLREAALDDAWRLRREAIDDFWRGADHLMASATERARRAATRLAHRLSRHRRTPAAPCGS